MCRSVVLLLLIVAILALLGAGGRIHLSVMPVCECLHLLDLDVVELILLELHSLCLEVVVV